MKVVIVGASGSLGGSLKSRGAELGMDLITVSRNSCEEHSSFTVDLLDIKNIEKSLENFPVMTGNDVVIINSGVIGPVALASEQEAEAVVDTFTVNALSNAFLYKALYAKGIKNFVVISSGAALKDYSGWFSYCQSKKLQKSIWEFICYESSDVSVRFIAPGVLNSAMHTFTEEVERGKYPDLVKFYEIREQGKYQDSTESATKILKLIQNPDFFSSGCQYLDLRDL